MTQNHKNINNTSELFFLIELDQQAHKWKNSPLIGSQTKSWLYMTIEIRIVEITRKTVSDFFAFCNCIN